MLPAEPKGVGRPIDDRAAWKAAARWPGLRDIVARAERIAGEPIPELTEELYLDYSRTGNRSRCQRVIFRRRERIATLVSAECVENRGRFVPAIEEIMRSLCSDNSWLLPAHDRGLRNWNGTTVEIDLNSSALSWTLATACYWLGNRLSPEIRQRVRSELERRTFAPFESYATKGAPRLWWATGTNNWNAVCLAGVTGSALAAIESPKRRAWFIAAAEQYVQHFLNGFTPDGYCSEGIGYYNYGFGHYVLLAETILQATGCQIDWMEDPRVRRIARFGPRMEILPGIYPAFADCSPRARPDPKLLAYLSRRYGFGWKAAEHEAIAQAGSERALFDMAIFDFPNSVSGKPKAGQPALGRALRDEFPEAQVFVLRPLEGVRRVLGVAIKGGHNAEHHNHNDAGTFVVALDGETPLVDPGSEVYTARTFSSRRYESKVLNSYGHPVPLVAGQMQRTGRSAAARVVRKEFTDGCDTIVLDLRRAYAVESLKRLERTFVFSRGDAGSLTVIDEVEFNAPQAFGTALITFCAKPEIWDREILVGDGDGRVRVAVSTRGANCKIRQETLDEDVHAPHPPVRIGIDLTEPVRQAAITLTIQPAGS